LAGFALGVLATLWLTAANQYAALDFLWPFPQKLASTWPLIFGVMATVASGYLCSLFAGRRKSKEDLRGLTLGCGRLGVRTRETATFPLASPEHPAKP
jgi:hypothetical protein